MTTIENSVLLTIIGIALATFVTKAGGYWLIQRVDVSRRIEAGLTILPGAILISLIAPRLVHGGIAEWISAGVVFVIAVRTGNILLAMVGGVGSVLIARAVLGSV